MRLLIFGEAFLSPAYLPRVRYFVSYFSRKGWQVDFVNEKSEYSYDVTIDYYKNEKGILGRLEWMIKFIMDLSIDFKGRYFYRKSQSFVTEKKYDLIFCSSSFTFPLTTAARMARKLDVPLFVDLRDIAEQSPDDNHFIAHRPPFFFGNILIKIYKRINIKRRNTVLRKAAGVTTVSPWHVKTLSIYNPNTHLIYNGFDEDLFIPEIRTTSLFTISYFGRIYNEKIRNPRLLFVALDELRKKKIISPGNTIVKWFVDEQSIVVVKNIAESYHLSEFIEFHNFTAPENLPAELNNSSLLLVLCNSQNTKNYFGIMTTKFFEALGANRPVICIPDNNDNLSEVIKNTQCGLVSSDATEVERYLQDKFSEWQQTGLTTGLLSEETRLDFSRKKGAETLEKLFENAIKKRHYESKDINS